MQEDNLTLENRTRTNEVAEWVIKNLEQDRIYSEITSLEREIQKEKAELSLITPKSNDTVRKGVYKRLGSMLDAFKNNKRDKLSKKVDAFDYIMEVIDKSIPEEIDTGKLAEFEVKNAIKSRSRCDSVGNLLDGVDRYNKYVADLKERTNLNMGVRVNEACHYARLLIKDDDHEPIEYFPHLFDEILNTGRGNASKLSDEQVFYVVDQFELRGRSYKPQPTKPFVYEGRKDKKQEQQDPPKVRELEKISVKSRSRDMEFDFAKTTDVRTGEVKISECACEDKRYHKNEDCYHRQQAKHLAGVPQAVQMDLNI